MLCKSTAYVTEPINRTLTSGFDRCSAIAVVDHGSPDPRMRSGLLRDLPCVRRGIPSESAHHGVATSIAASSAAHAQERTGPRRPTGADFERVAAAVGDSRSVTQSAFYENGGTRPYTRLFREGQREPGGRSSPSAT